MTILIASCLAMAATNNNVPLDLLYAIAKVESGLNASAVSSDKEDWGLMQVRKRYVAAKYKGKLLDPCINAQLAAEKLKQKAKECKFKHNFTYVVCYNRGIAGAKRSVSNPYADRYYKKVMHEKNKITMDKNFIWTRDKRKNSFR